MAVINILGVNHNDPFGRQIITQLLKQYSENGVSFDGIAIEWEEAMAKHVIAQREQLFHMLKATYPSNSDEQLRLFSNAAAYEADSHFNSYPNAPIIWLDEGRQVCDDMLATYAQDRLRIYKSNAITCGNYLDVHATREQLLRVGASSPEATLRDERFFNTIQSAVTKGFMRILCVIGAMHMNTTESGMFGQRLVQAGYDVSTCDIRRIKVE